MICVVHRWSCPPEEAASWDWSRFPVSQRNLKRILQPCVKKASALLIEYKVPLDCMVWEDTNCIHYSDAIVSTMASKITGFSIVYPTVWSDTDQRKHQGSASLAFVRGIHRWPVNSHTKGQLRGKCSHLMMSSCEISQTGVYRSVFVKLSNG